MSSSYDMFRSFSTSISFFFFLHVSVIPKFILPGQFSYLFIGFAAGQPETRPDVVVRSLYL